MKHVFLRCWAGLLVSALFFSGLTFGNAFTGSEIATINDALYVVHQLETICHQTSVQYDSEEIDALCDAVIAYCDNQSALSSDERALIMQKITQIKKDFLVHDSTQAPDDLSTTKACTTSSAPSAYRLLLPTAQGGQGQALGLLDNNGTLGWLSSLVATSTITLYGDVVGSATATRVATICGVPACNVIQTYSTVLSATACDLPLTLVLRDSTGSFSATTITLTGNTLIKYSTVGLCDTGSGFIFAPTNGNTSIGLGAGNGVGSDNTVLGFLSLTSIGTSCTDNTAIGAYAGQNLTQGSYNVMVGSAAGAGLMQGNNNIAVGYLALSQTGSFCDNIAIGINALFENQGIQNVAIGSNALVSTVTGTNNIAIGYNAGSSCLGSNNIYIGSGVTGSSTDNGTIQIGGPEQTSTYIAGIVGIGTIGNTNYTDDYILNLVTPNNTALAATAPALVSNSNIQTIVLTDSTHVAMITSLNTVALIDVSNSSEFSLSSLVTDSITAPFAVAAQNNYLYVLNSGVTASILQFDTLDPENPVLTASQSIIDYGQPSSICATNGYVYVLTTNSYLLVFDQTLTLIGSAYLPNFDSGIGTSLALTVSNNYGYISCNYLIGGIQLVTVDVNTGSVPGAISYLGKFITRPSFSTSSLFDVVAPQSLTISNNLLIASYANHSEKGGGGVPFIGGGVQFYDISNPASPQYITYISNMPIITQFTDIITSVVRGNFLYVLNGGSTGDNSIYIFDISDLSNIIFIGQYAYQPSTIFLGDMINSGNNFYLTAQNQSLLMLSFPQPILIVAGDALIDGSLILAPTTADTGQILIGGTTALQAYNNNLFLAGSGNYSASQATSNFAAGAGSLFNLTSGTFNNVIGYDAGLAVNSGLANNIMGYLAGGNLLFDTTDLAISASQNNFIGSYAGGAPTNTTNYTYAFNNAVGYGALYGGNMINNQYNNAIGYYAGGTIFSTNQTNAYNNFLGYCAGFDQINATYNNVIGYYAGQGGSNSNGANNNNVLGNNSFIDLANSPNNNIVVGNNTLIGGINDISNVINNNIVLGNNNLSDFINTLEYTNNIVLGNNNLSDDIDGAAYTNNIYITNNINPSSESNVIRIGSGQSACYIGGIYGSPLSNGLSGSTLPVVVNSSGQLGVGSSNSYLYSATSANVPLTLVLRDNTGSFATTTITVTGALNILDNNENLAGVISAQSNALIIAPQAGYALQASALGNPRGQGAVDLQIGTAANSAQVASGQYSAIVGGYDNIVSGSFSTVAGGYNNNASNYYNFIGTGYQNIASGFGAVVIGGGNDQTGYTYPNKATGALSFVGCGAGNVASGFGSVVVGGGTGGTIFGTDTGNTAQGRVSFVGSGLENTASGDGSVVVGGGYDGSTPSGNTAAGSASFVGGGLNNKNTTGNYAVIGGGSGNNASNTAASVLGGQSNNASGSQSSVGGGGGNNASGSQSAVFGGGNNNAAGSQSFIGGGSNNQNTTGNYAVIAGGSGNSASNGYVAVLGGQSNIASGYSSSIVGGGSNNVSGQYSAVVAGYDNIISGSFSTVAGGQGNNASNYYNFIGTGYQNIASGFGAVVIGGGDDQTGYYHANQATGTLSFVGCGGGNVASGYASVVVGGGTNGMNFGPNTGNTAQGIVSFVGSGLDNVASGAGSVVVGGGYDGTTTAGNGNTAAGNASFVGGGLNNKNTTGNYAVIVGGSGNSASNTYASVLGGQSNTASGRQSAILGGGGNNATGSYGSILGGYSNQANGDYSVALGQQAIANGTGSFVFADSQNRVFTSAANDSFNIRAQNGLVFQGNSTGSITLAVPSGLTAQSSYALTLPPTQATGPNQALFNNGLGQLSWVTTLTGGIESLNGLTAPSQYLTTSTQINTLGWSALTTATNQLNIPYAGNLANNASSVGLITGADYYTFNSSYTTVQAATSQDIPNTLVRRDATGSFIATTVTLTGNSLINYSTSRSLPGSGFVFAPTNRNTLMGLGAGNNNILTGTGNTAFGYYALQTITTGYQNTAFGANALTASGSYTDCVAVGYNALNNNTATGSVAVGSNALAANGSATGNTAVGYFAGSGVASNNVTAVGYQAAESAGTFSTAVGYQSFQAGNGGYNTAVGATALAGTGNYSDCVAVGALALNANQAICNVAVGSTALRYNTTGYYNTAVGYQALTNNGAGGSNTALGAKTLTGGTSSISYTDCVAVGYNALNINIATGSVAVGSNALANNTSATANTAVGYYAANAATGNNTTALGYQALYKGSSGTNNTAVGASSLAATGGPYTYGDCTAVGYNALNNNTATGNTAVGSGALALTGANGANTAVGYQAANGNVGGSVTAVGYGAGQAAGSNCTVVGRGAFYQGTGINNTAMAVGALAGTGNYSDCVAVGYVALGANTATGNTAVGSNALATNTSGTGNTALGYYAARNSTGYNTTAIGYEAFYQGTGQNNTAVGSGALVGSGSYTDCVAVGAFALQNNNQYYNVAVGSSAGSLINTGSNNTLIGTFAGQSLTGGSNNVIIGYYAGTAIGGNTYSTANSSILIGAYESAGNTSGQIHIGNPASGQGVAYTSCYIGGINGITASGGTTVYCNTSNQLGTINSSKRYKENINDLGTLSENIYKLRPVQFNYINDEQKWFEAGLIAEEVEEIYPQIVVYKDGLPETLRYQHLPIMMLNEQQKDHARIATLEAQNSAYAQTLATVQQQIAELQAKIQQLVG